MMRVNVKLPPRYPMQPATIPVIGEKFNDEGIFIGRYEPTDRQGNKLGKVFNVFAAPEDLTDEAGKKATFWYYDAVDRISRLENWHGHDGGVCNDDSYLDQILGNGRYKGEWVMPPIAVLTGKDKLFNDVSANHIVAHRAKGDLAGTFPVEVNDNPPFHPAWYWSCSLGAADALDSAHAVRMTDGDRGRLDKVRHRLSVRPVRFVPVKGNT